MYNRATIEISVDFLADTLQAKKEKGWYTQTLERTEQNTVFGETVLQKWRRN